MPNARKRVLLFAEAVTLAHVARPLAFAQALPPDRFHVAIATAEAGAAHVRATGIEQIPLFSIEPKVFLDSLSSGKPLYDARTLNRYVKEDLQIIDSFQPDLIVGDFRLSLSVSARLAGVPYAAIASAYWSPYYTPPDWPVPDLPMTHWLPIGLAQSIFRLVRPLAFRLHCRPLNEVRRQHGLAALEPDLRMIYTDADYVLYSDVPQLFRLENAPKTHEFLGPVLWEPVVGTPGWWDALPEDLPTIYVTLGSSGAAALLPRIVEALARLPVNVMVALAGGGWLPPAAPNVFAAPYLPGLKAAGRADIVVFNGGSLTAYQGLSAGVPVLGIAGNLDQLLNMQAICRASAGAVMRADRFSMKELATAARNMLDLGTGSVALAEFAAASKEMDFRENALRFVDHAVFSP